MSRLRVRCVGDLNSLIFSFTRYSFLGNIGLASCVSCLRWYFIVCPFQSIMHEFKRKITMSIKRSCLTSINYLSYCFNLTTWQMQINCSCYWLWEVQIENLITPDRISQLLILVIESRRVIKRFVSFKVAKVWETQIVIVNNNLILRDCLCSIRCRIPFRVCEISCLKS